MLEILLSIFALFGAAFALKIACLEWKGRLRQFRGFQVKLIEKAS
jgi:hypothetical protein